MTAARGSRVSGRKKMRWSLARSAWTFGRLDWIAGRARSGSSAKRVGTGPFIRSESKYSAFRGQAMMLMVGRLSLNKI